MYLKLQINLFYNPAAKYQMSVSHITLNKNIFFVKYKMIFYLIYLLLILFYFIVEIQNQIVANSFINSHFDKNQFFCRYICILKVN